MNKSELIKAISEKSGMDKSKAETFLSSFIDVVKNTVAKGESVQLIGFGMFELRHREARMGRNPRTGENLNIPASNVPVFKVGKNFKDAINK